MAGSGKKVIKCGGGVLATVLLLAAIFGGKTYMDRKELERSYQDGMQQVQEHVTEYLVGNYAGIETVEWQGIGVEWRDSPIFGPSMFGNYVESEVWIYLNDKDHFTIPYTLSDETEYDDEQERYVLNGTLTPSNMDVGVGIGLYNATHELNADRKRAFEKIMKSDAGSPTAKLSYDLEVHELKY